MSKLRPLGDNVIVKPFEQGNTTATGIYTGDVKKEKPMKGEIIAIGNGTDDKKLDAKVGDTVVFTQYAPTEIKIGNDDFYILGFDSVLAVEE